MMAILGGGIIVAFVQRSIPEDPAILFEQALAAAEKQDGGAIKTIAEKLAKYPEYERKKKYLEGMLLMGSSRPLKAIDLLKESAEEPSIRMRSLLLLGSAYAQSEKFDQAIETFESAVKEDEGSNDVRYRLASLYKELMALDLAVSQLDILISKEFKLSETLKMRAEIRVDQRKISEAVEDYEAAIRADKNNPINSLIAERLIQCFLKLQNLEKAEEYVELADQSPVKGFFEAEKLLRSGDLQKLPPILESLRTSAGFDARTHIIYGKMMLNGATPERAVEALAGLQPGLRVVTRNVELYRVVVELARAAGDEKMALAAQQNVDQLQELDKQFADQIAIVSATRPGFEERLKLAQLAFEIGLGDFAMMVYQSLSRSFPERTADIAAFQDKLYAPLPPLVDLPNSSAANASDPAQPAGDVKETTNSPSANASVAPPATEPTPTTESK